MSETLETLGVMFCIVVALLICVAMFGWGESNAENKYKEIMTDGDKILIEQTVYTCSPMEAP